MNYDETVDFLYSRLPMFSRVGSAAFKKDLTNIKLLCEQLHQPQQTFKSIHVTGTNGKGSVSHMLAAVLQTAGYKTGLYTSPHLFDFRERIRVNGKKADKEYVVAFTEKIRPLIERIQPSFFEITVAMAFSYFAQQKVDVAVIEVGLGGRLDSTNIILPQLSIITNIGFDHMNMLGHTLEKIAFEKAGIIKQHVPVVIGEVLPETRPVFLNKAAEMQAPVFFAEEIFQSVQHRWSEDFFEITLRNLKDETTCTIHTDLNGIYQLKNLPTVLCALQLLEKEFPGCVAATEKALKEVKKLTGLRGRWEVVNRQPTVVLEVAHNADGIQQMVKQIAEWPHQQLHLIVGMVKDKEVDSVLELLPAEALFYFSQAQIERALPAGELQQKAAAKNLHGRAFGKVNDALKAALERANSDDLIVVCGSIFLVAEVNLSEFQLAQPG